MDGLPEVSAERAKSQWRMACFVDVETTGLNPKADEVIELALVRVAFDPTEGAIHGIVDRYSDLREPSCAISAGARRVHGISRRQLRGEKLDCQRVESVLRETRLLVAHNASFDRRFLGKLFPRTEETTWLCSMRDVDWYGKGFSSRSLQNLLAAHGLRVARKHRALHDAEATLRLLSQEDKDGTTYFCEMLANKRYIVAD